MRCCNRCEKALTAAGSAFWTWRTWWSLSSMTSWCSGWESLLLLRAGGLEELQAPWVLGSSEFYPLLTPVLQFGPIFRKKHEFCPCHFFIIYLLGTKLCICPQHFTWAMCVTVLPATQHLGFILANLAVILWNNLLLSSRFRVSKNNPSSRAVYPFYIFIFVLRLFSRTNDF